MTAKHRVRPKKRGEFGTLRKSLGARLFTFPVTAISGVGSTYLLVSHYGAISFGAISLLATLFLLIPFTDFGMGAPIMSGVADPTKTLVSKAQLVARVFWFLIFSSLVLVALVTTLSRFVSWSAILGNEHLNRSQFDHAFVAVVAIFVISIPFGIGSRILIGIGLNHVAIAIAGLSSLVNLACTYVFVNTQISPPYAAIAPSLGILFSAIVGFVIALNRLQMHPRLLLIPGKLRIRELFKTSGPMFIVMLMIPVAFQSHRILISRYADPIDLSVYSIAMQIYVPIWSLVSTSAVALWPIFANKRQARMDTAKLYRKALALFTLGGVLISCAIILIGPVFAAVVSDASIELSTSILIALGFLLIVQCVQQVPGMFLTSEVGLAFQARSVVVMCVVAIVLGIYLTKNFGAIGPLLATACAVLCCQVIPGLWKSRSMHDDGQMQDEGSFLAKESS